MILILRRTWKKIRVPDGIWSHDPPWSSQMLSPLSYWRLYGEQGPVCGSRLEPHHAATQPSNDWHTRTHYQHRAVTLKHIQDAANQPPKKCIKDETTTNWYWFWGRLGKKSEWTHNPPWSRSRRVVGSNPIWDLDTHFGNIYLMY